MEPVILNTCYWHKLPKRLRRRYAGQSRMGRVYALDTGGHVEYVWSEGSIYEEAAWHRSRVLSLRSDHEVIAILRGDVYGKAV